MSKRKAREGFVTVAHAAAYLGVTKMTIHNWIVRGHLKAEKADTLAIYEIPDSELLRIKTKPGPRQLVK